MVRWLLIKFPDDVVMDIVTTKAAALGALDILKLLLCNDRAALSSGRALYTRDTIGAGREINFGYGDATKAAANGHSEVVRWLYMHADGEGRLDVEVIAAAVASGNIQLAMWLEEYLEIPAVHTGDSLSFDHYWMSADYGLGKAAGNGHLEMVQWILKRYNDARDADQVLIQAAEHGHLDIVRWAVETEWHGKNLWRLSEQELMKIGAQFTHAIHVAACNGHLRTGKYLLGRIKTLFNKSNWVRGAIKVGKNLDSVRMKSCQDNAVTGTTMQQASRNGSLQVIKWLHAEFAVTYQHNFFTYVFCKPWRYEEIKEAITAAATNGTLDVVQYLQKAALAFKMQTSRKRKRVIVSMDLSTPCVDVPKQGEREAMDGAAANNHFDVVKWLHLNRPKECTTRAMDLAARNGHLKMVQWLSKHRTEGSTTDAMDGAALNGHLKVVKWLHKHTSSGCTTEAIDGAACRGHLEVVKWLHANRKEGCTKRAMGGAASFVRCCQVAS